MKLILFLIVSTNAIFRLQNDWKVKKNRKKLTRALQIA
jgi:hypothetical protein